MKSIFIIILFFTEISVKAQNAFHLDTAKLAIISKDGLALTPLEINKADSILINIVNYYNSRVDRKYSLVYLSDSEYSEFTKLDSLKNYYSCYLTKKGKVKKVKLSKLELSKQSNILNLIKNKTSTELSISEYIAKGTKIKYDSLILSYGSQDRIDIENYCRQYTINKYDDGTIHLNALCFCKEMVANNLIPWKKNPIKNIHDGGSCVFKVSIDLSKGFAKMMKVNGM